MSDKPLTVPPDDYLMELSAKIFKVIGEYLNDPMKHMSTTIETSEEKGGLGNETLTYSGSLYDVSFMKERGPSMTIRMRLRAR